MKTAGGTATRIIQGVKGALGNLQHTSYIGPKTLNGGEVVVGAGESSFCFGFVISAVEMMGRC